MDAETFVTRVNEFSVRYKEWWFPPFQKFLISKEHPKYNYQHYFEAYKKFETELRNQNDLVGEFYDFVDENYEIYLTATTQQQEEIRKSITAGYYVDDKGSLVHFMEDLFLRYTNERAIPLLKETGDKIWLTRGLVAISLENSGIDFRDTILALRGLRNAANQRNVDSHPEFIRIAQISSNQKPRGRSTPMRELMANEGKL